MNSVDALTRYLSNLQAQEDLQRASHRDAGLRLAKIAQALVETIEAALQRPRAEKLLSHVRVVRIASFGKREYAIALELTGIKVQVAGLELDFTPQLCWVDNVGSIRFNLKNFADNRPHLTYREEVGWVICWPSGRTSNADTEAIASLILESVKQTHRIHERQLIEAVNSEHVATRH